MRIGLLADPYLFTRIGGIQRKILNTEKALNEIGVNAKIFKAGIDCASDYDLFHLFDAENCNFKLTEFAKDNNIPLVLSPVLSPSWTRADGIRSKTASYFTSKISRQRAHTTYEQTLWALSSARKLLALGDKEKKALMSAFYMPEGCIEIVPNGVGEQFFNATPGNFCKNYNVKPGFVLCVGSIYPHKNQLDLAKSLEDSEINIVLIGPCKKENEGYLQSLLQYRNITYLGPISYDDQDLASAYASASVFVLPSVSEVMPNTVLEALAAGTYVVLTKNHSIDIDFTDEFVSEVEPGNIKQIKEAVLKYYHREKSPAIIKKLVEDLTWLNIARKLKHIYEISLSER